MAGRNFVEITDLGGKGLIVYLMMFKYFSKLSFENLVIF